MRWRVVPLVGLVIALGLGGVGLYADSNEPKRVLRPTCPAGYVIHPLERGFADVPLGVTPDDRTCRDPADKGHREFLPASAGGGWTTGIVYDTDTPARFVPALAATGPTGLQADSARYWWYAAAAIFLVGLSLPLTVGRRSRDTP